MSDHAINGWTFKIEEDTGRPVSWVFRNVKTWDHNFAREISVEKIIVEVEAGGKSERLSLEYSHFEAQSGEDTSKLLHRTQEGTYTLSLANFSVYQGKGRLLRLKTKEGVLPPNEVGGEKIDEPLYLFVAFIFSEYGTDPPHEFTGALAAARFTPAIRIETKNKSVQSIRIDYRFHFDLDSYLQTAGPLTRLEEELKNQWRGRENYALVIRDADHFPPSVLGVVRLFKEVFALHAGVDFFDARLAECEYEGTCQFQCSSLELELAQAKEAANQLNITFHAPGKTLSAASKPLAKTSVSVTDGRVVTLLEAGYDKARVDSLAEKIFNAVVGTAPVKGISEFSAFVPVFSAGSALPGVSDECLSRCIKYSLLRLVARSYVLRKGEAILERLELLGKTIKSDLKDVMEYVEPSDLEKVLADIGYLIPHLLLVSPVTLVQLAELAVDLQELAGKLMSIVAFDAAEKPVLWELVGRYVIVGNVTDTWDNMHWWGTEKIPSAPGAFFAVHSHFRWTQVNAYPTPEEAELLGMVNAALGGSTLHLGAPQLRSLVKKFAENQLSGPLIDPDIPNQTVLFAIALSGGELDRALLDRTPQEATRPFDEVTLKPKPIAWVSSQGNKGSNIVYWVSCKAQRAGEEVFKGTLLVNGFYFAHDEEKPFSLFRRANMFAPTEGIDLQKPKRTEPYDLVRDPC